MKYIINAATRIELEINLTDDGNFRPDTLNINGEIATREAKWISTARGNLLQYKMPSGITYTIPQEFIRNLK